MKIDKIIQIKLTEPELKSALLDYLYKINCNPKYCEHIKQNLCTMEWADGEFVIDADGVLKDFGI